MSNQNGRNGRNGRNVQNSSKGKNGRNGRNGQNCLNGQSVINGLNSQNGLSGHLHKLKFYHKLLKENRIICSKNCQLRFGYGYGFAIALWCLTMISYSMSLACHRFGHDECWIHTYRIIFFQSSIFVFDSSKCQKARNLIIITVSKGVDKNFNYLVLENNQTLCND